MLNFIKENDVWTALSNGAIWDESNIQHQQ